MPSFERPGFYANHDEDTAAEEPQSPDAVEAPTIPENAEPAELGGFDVDFSFDSTLSAPNEAMDKVKKGLEEVDWPKEEIDAFVQAVQEAVTNAVVHNNLGINHEEGESSTDYVNRIIAAAAGENGKKKINVSVQVRMNDLVVKIKDEGKYVMEVGDIKDPTAPENLLVPNGRGQFLIFNGCDEVMSYPGELVLIKHRGGLKPSVSEPEASSPEVKA